MKKVKQASQVKSVIHIPDSQTDNARASLRTRVLTLPLLVEGIYLNEMGSGCGLVHPSKMDSTASGPERKEVRRSVRGNEN